MQCVFYSVPLVPQTSNMSCWAAGIAMILGWKRHMSIPDQIIAANPGQIAQFKGGNEKVIGWFMGQVMKATQGKANPQTVTALLREKLGAGKRP